MKLTSDCDCLIDGRGAAFQRQVPKSLLLGQALALPDQTAPKNSSQPVYRAQIEKNKITNWVSETTFEPVEAIMPLAPQFLQFGTPRTPNSIIFASLDSFYCFSNNLKQESCCPAHDPGLRNSVKFLIFF